MYSFNPEVGRPGSPDFEVENDYYDVTNMSGNVLVRVGHIKIMHNPRYLDIDLPYITSLVMSEGFDPRSKQFWFDDTGNRIVLLFTEQLVCDQKVYHSLYGSPVGDGSWAGSWTYPASLEPGSATKVGVICHECYDSFNNNGVPHSLRRIRP